MHLANDIQVTKTKLQDETDKYKLCTVLVATSHQTGQILISPPTDRHLHTTIVNWR